MDLIEFGSKCLVKWMHVDKNIKFHKNRSTATHINTRPTKNLHKMLRYVIYPLKKNLASASSSCRVVQVATTNNSQPPIRTGARQQHLEGVLCNITHPLIQKLSESDQWLLNYKVADGVCINVILPLKINGTKSDSQPPIWTLDLQKFYTLCILSLSNPSKRIQWNRFSIRHFM